MCPQTWSEVQPSDTVETFSLLEVHKNILFPSRTSTSSRIPSKLWERVSISRMWYVLCKLLLLPLPEFPSLWCFLLLWSARMGQCLLRSGKWRGTNILPLSLFFFSWVHQCTGTEPIYRKMPRPLVWVIPAWSGATRLLPGLSGHRPNPAVHPSCPCSCVWTFPDIFFITYKYHNVSTLL